MDIYHVLEEMEKVVEKATRIPIIGKALVDVDLILDNIDRLRGTIPEEIRQANWLAKEKERVLSEANGEAERLLAETRKRTENLSSETEIVKQAHQRAEEIIEQAREMAREMRAGALIYADEVMSKLQENLEKNLLTIQEGRNQLQNPVKKGIRSESAANKS